MDLAIIGGGASGLILASYLKRKNLNINITIFERNKSLGRKILASGNGRCNFSNFKATSSDYNNPSFIDRLYKNIKKEDLINYFSSLGLMFYFDNEGRMYPISESSETILSLFVSDLKDTRVICDYTVKNVEVKNNKYYVDGKLFDYVVFASGSNASIDLKKVSSTYSYFKDLDINFNKVLPSLVGFQVNDDIKCLKGYRSKGIVSLFDLNNNLVFNEFGEIMFKEDGISGIVVMNSSHYYKEGYKIKLNLISNVDKNELLYKLETRFNNYKDKFNYLSGIIHPTLGKYLIKNNIIKPIDVINKLENFNFDIISTYPLVNAQVSKGGISVDEIDDFFRLKKYNHIFVLGELLDINGLCGGYNLMFAFMTGLLAAKKIEELYEGKNN